ncbi:MAG: chitobiase/beta-hexosaminidase C-terminal domain-containing protein [Sphingobacteriales bacterium]|nr:chitobiase/beta-hexosaminidase C-terminal domain-containing protein [Sphingobacteriales bacterium]OJY91862.1 MAG: hypothetical protein BGP14_23315 [Sphingobacteriales bacterium 44-15]
MQKILKIGSGVLFGTMVFLLFLVVFQGVLSLPAWLAVAGRMHPMFLHFPIVLLLLSFITIWVPGGKNLNDEWLSLLRLTAALSAALTAIMGMLLSLEDGRTGILLEQHKWGGVIIAVLGFLFYAYFPLLAGKALFARAFTVIATAAIIITGHWGADLTHGEDYVLGPLKKNEIHAVPPDKAVVFADIIQPILEKKCVSCHGKASTKGGLLLSDIEGVMAGGKAGPLFIPGLPDTSLIIHRIQLPQEDKKHMPPSSKPQLTQAEAALLYAWIQSGAATDAPLFSLPEKDTFRVLATNYLQPEETPGMSEPVYDFAAADEKKIAALNNNYRIVVPLGKNSPALSVNFFGKSAYSTKSLEELLAVKQQVTQLSLARMPVKDADMKVIGQLVNLRKLNLNYTDITPAGISGLGALKHLQELTLSGTRVNPEAIEKLLPSTAITSLFVWDTKIDSTQLLRLRAKFPSVDIQTGFVDKGDDIVALSPPFIRTPAGIFDKDASVEITHPFKGVEIRYTLDETEPDSVNSPVYTTPLHIDKNTTIKARAFKKGWYGSGDAQASFIKRGVVPDSVVLVSKPDPKYMPSQATALIDGQLGDVSNISNGDWFGYYGSDAAYYLLFKKTVTIKDVLLNMMQNLGGHIFPPATIDIWGGADSSHLRLLGSSSPTVPEKGSPSRLLQEQVQFPPAEVQCLKIMVRPAAALPAWHDSKGKPAWAFISEVVLD